MSVYKIMLAEEWAEFEATGNFKGSYVDLNDGFIHFSTREQTADTANKHFSDKSGLVLVAVDETQLGEKLCYEPSRGGQLFPHLYSTFSMDAVQAFTSFYADEFGNFYFPKDFI